MNVGTYSGVAVTPDLSTLPTAITDCLPINVEDTTATYDGCATIASEIGNSYSYNIYLIPSEASGTATFSQLIEI